MSHNPFLLNLKDYKMNVDPVNDYIKQATVFLHKMTNEPMEVCRGKVKKKIRENKPIDPKVHFYHRKENLDKEQSSSSLTNYIKSVKQNKQILMPSFTVYTHPDKKRSLHSDFTMQNIVSRSKAKKEAFSAKMRGDFEEFKFKNTLQKTMKIYNNSLSGAYASVSTNIMNPSAHYSLTSVTRCVSAIGNSITEMMVAGNRHYRKPETVINHITATITEVDLNKIEKVIQKYQLEIPTITDVFNMVLASTRFYWENDDEEKFILEYISKLTDIERSAFMYVNDFCHIRERNSKLVMRFLNRLSSKEIGLVREEEKEKVFKNTPGYIVNLVHHILNEELKGVEVKYEEIKGTQLFDMMVSTMVNVDRTLEEYSDLIKAFFVTTVSPIDIAYLRDIMRKSIVLSDTDSTCGTYQDWVIWKYGEVVFSPESTALAASVMTVTTQAIDHYIKVFSGNMNIPEEHMDKLEMKNEFFWETYAPANVTKHYYANVNIQEGMVFDKAELELKGVHLIAGNIPPEYKKKSEEMMIRINDTVRNNEKIEIIDYITEIAELEREVIERFDKGDTDILRIEKIKNADSYKQDPEESKYSYYLMWKEVYGELYGETTPPPYTGVKLPTYTDTKAKMKAYMDKIENPVIKNNLEKYMKKNKKDYVGTVILPLAALGGRGIPKELMKHADKKRVVFDICFVFYIILETLGFYRKDDMTLTEMGY